MNFDFKHEDKVVEAVLQKKSVFKMPKFNLFPRNFFMNLSFSRIPAGIWSLATLMIAVAGMHYHIANAQWVIAIGCLLYYSSNKEVPFAVMLVSMAGMVLGIPELAYLLFFSVFTMVNWSRIF